jgi:hypothetical protein
VWRFFVRENAFCECLCWFQKDSLDAVVFV